MQVLVAPKAGWWGFSLRYLTEHDLHVARAMLGCVYTSATGTRDIQHDVLYGPFDDAVYGSLAALTASVFVRMAIHQRGPDGRARRQGGEPPSHEVFAANHFEPPRYIVAMLAFKAASANSTQILFTAERARLFHKVGSLFVLGVNATNSAALVSIALLSWMHRCTRTSVLCY